MIDFNVPRKFVGMDHLLKNVINGLKIALG